jgi:mevalonate kinase
MTESSAPAKIILLGEHAVVYGQPAIAVPVSSLRAIATAVPAASGSGLHIIAADLDQILPVNVDSDLVDNALIHTARLFLTTIGHPAPDLAVTLHSQIPMASGLGSGAAVSTALARALNGAFGNPLDTAQINDLIFQVETLHHGTPSGIDNTVIVYEQPIYFVRGKPLESIRIGAPFTLLIADTGQGALTKVAVGAVRERYNAEREIIEPILDAVGALAQEARRAIEAGDSMTLGKLMCRNHEYLKSLTVSSRELDILVDAAVQAGALGAKLSGGGRGGNLIALVTAESASHIHTALARAGAVRVFQTTVGVT